MKVCVVLLFASAGCDGVFGLQHLPERTADAAVASDALQPLDVAPCTTSGPPATYPVGMSPQGLTIAELTGDDAVDIATANAGAGTVTVLENAGDGTFGGVMNDGDLVADAGAGRVVAARIDAGDAVDLVSSNFSASNLSVFFAEASGGFSPRGEVMTGTNTAPVGIAAGSFAGTSEGDLAVVLSSQAKVGVYLWNGSSYTIAPTIDVGLQPAEVVAARLDGDTTLDLAVTNAGTGSVSVALGVGNGTFRGAQNTILGSLPRALAAAPLAPGMPTSLFVASSGNGSIDMLRNDGDASFSPQTVATVGGAPLGIAAGDIDGDGFTDLAITSSATDRLYVLGGNGLGSFTARPPLETGAFPVGVGVADFDRDGHADIAVANQGDNTVSVFLGCH